MRGAFGFLPDRLRDDRGSALVLVALSATALISFAALAIDIGMLMTARDEAQRAADASALAAAAEYMKAPATDAVAPGKQWAKNLAAENYVRNVPIDTTLVSATTLVDSTNQMVVQMMPDSFKARVTVYRPSLGLWFARIFGVNSWDVAATAVAQATDAGAAKCLKPFVIPDIWKEATQDTITPDGVMDSGEQWTFSPDTDTYLAFNGQNNPDATGYGSSLRDGIANANGNSYTGDYGRQLSLKFQNPNTNSLSSYVPTPGVFLPWDLPDSTGSTASGAKPYQNNIQTCNTNAVQLGTPYPIETGNMVGPTYFGVDSLIAQDPNASWDATNKKVVGSSYGSDWIDSPRVVKLAMAAPGQLYKPGKQTVTFNNFALFFVEGMTDMHSNLVGRFLYYATGESSGPVKGSLVKHLRLVN